jgi:hypothetical protein
MAKLVTVLKRTRIGSRTYNAGDQLPWTGSEEDLEKLVSRGLATEMDVEAMKADPREVGKMVQEYELLKSELDAVRTKESELKDENKNLVTDLNSVADALGVETSADMLAKIEEMKAWAPVSGVGLAPGVKFDGLVAIKSGKLTITVAEPGDLAHGEKVEIFRPLTSMAPPEKKEGE